jgi:hypothetical protein
VTEEAECPTHHLGLTSGSRTWPSSPTTERATDKAHALTPLLRGEDLDAALRAVADFADVKSPYMLGHSRNVERRVGQAGCVHAAAELDRIWLHPYLTEWMLASSPAWQPWV